MTSANTSPGEWLNTQQVAEEYGFNPRTLRYWRHLGYGPASFNRGRRVAYRRSEVERWLRAQEEATRRGGSVA